MADQKTMNGATSGMSATTESVGGSLQDFVGDLAELGELQFKLMRRDAQAGLKQAGPSLMAVGVGLCVILSGVFVAITGLAEALAALGSLSRPAAFLTVGFGAVIVGSLASWFLLGRIAAAGENFRRSTEELVRNVAWVRMVLTESGRARPRRS